MPAGTVETEVEPLVEQVTAVGCAVEIVVGRQSEHLAVRRHVAQNLCLGRMGVTHRRLDADLQPGERHVDL